jgi:hypothetical protein
VREILLHSCASKLLPKICLSVFCIIYRRYKEDSFFKQEKQTEGTNLSANLWFYKTQTAIVTEMLANAKASAEGMEAVPSTI